MKNRIDEHDMTKKMMEIMRGGYKDLLKEDASGQAAPSPNGGAPSGPSAAPDSAQPFQQGDDSPEPQEDQDTLTPKKGDAVFNDQLKKLQTLNPMVQIDNFKIYPNDANVIIEGVFLKRAEQDSGIKFKMALTAGELETSMNNIDLNDTVSELLNRLNGYYQIWCDEWAMKMTNEYKPKSN